MITQLLTGVLLAASPMVVDPAVVPPFLPPECAVEVTSVQPLGAPSGLANGSGLEFSFLYTWNVIGALFLEVHMTSGSYEIVGAAVDVLINDIPVTYTQMDLLGPTYDADFEFALAALDAELVSLSVFLSRCGAAAPVTTTTAVTTTTVPAANIPNVPVTTVPSTTLVGASALLPSTGSSSGRLAVALIACAFGLVMVAIARRSRPA